MMAEGIGWDAADDMLLLICRDDARGDTNAEEVKDDNIRGDGIVDGERRHRGAEMTTP